MSPTLSPDDGQSPKTQKSCMKKLVYKYFKNIFKNAEKISEVWFYIFQISSIYI
jgi:hypothetical protein